MKIESKKLLEDVREAGSFIQKLASGKSRADYLADEVLQAAIERKFEIIGEALRRLSRWDPATGAEFERLPRIVSFRNILIHGYDIVDSNVVWDIVERSLPDLLSKVQALLSRDTD